MNHALRRSILAHLLVLIPAVVCSQDSPPPAVPSDVGIFYRLEGKLTHVEGRAASFGRTGTLLSSAVAAGNKSWKVDAQIPGKRADLVMGSMPIFYYHIPTGGEAAGGSAGNLVLVKMSVKGNRRQFEMGAAGMGGASSGISIRSQVDFKKTEISSGFYRVQPYAALGKGQYAFYLFHGYDLPGFAFDFMVE